MLDTMPHARGRERVDKDTDGIAATVAAAAAAAEDVDASARFPREAVAEMRKAGLLSCSFPVECGGSDTPIRDLASISRQLGGACSSTGMIFAMHHSQAAAIARHATGRSERLIRDIVASDALIASATTEITTGGDTRNSTCAVVTDGTRITLDKNTPVISYGEFADYIAITARRHPDSASHDQVLVVAPRADIAMEKTAPWDVIGFRGTCSPGFILHAATPTENVLPTDYATISERTVLPTAHILWASVWLGMADAAVRKARGEVRSAVRKAGGSVTPQTSKFADLLGLHQRFESFLTDSIARYEKFLHSGDDEPTVGLTIALNNLKLHSSTLIVDVVTSALEICGLNGYRQNHPAAMGRLLRDSFAPQLMVSNDRIRANNSDMALAFRHGGNL